MVQENKSSIIYDNLKKRIELGEFDHYQILPTEKELENYYSASRNTIRKAIRKLNSEGLVYSRVGSSNVVLKRINVDNLLIDSGNVNRPSKISNDNVSTKIILFEKKKIDNNVNNTSTFSLGEECFHVIRLRYINNQPTMIDDSYFLSDSVPNLTEEIASNSIYDYIEKKLGRKIIGSKLVDRIIQATPMDIENLNLLETSSVGLTQNWSYFSDGNIFEYTEIHFSPERYVRTRFISR